MHIELVQLNNNTSSIGGIGRYAHELYEQLQQRSDQLTVSLTTTLSLPLSKRFPTLNSLPIGVTGHQPGNLVHFMQIGGCSQMLWRPLHPSLVTVHDLGVLINPVDSVIFNPLDRFLIALQYRGLKQVDHFVAISQFTADTIEEYLKIPREQIHVVYHGVNASHFQPMPNAKAILADRYQIQTQDFDVNLLYIGNELPRKNLSMVLQALAVMRKRGLKMRLIKVGTAGGNRWREQSLIQVRQLKLEESVVFVDKVPEVDLPAFYSAADVFILLSKLEGFCFPVIEAMHCNLPVVCSNTTALPEIVGTAAYTVDPTNLDQIVEALSNVSGNETLKAEMRRKGRVQAAQFSYKRSIDTLCQVYQSIR